MKLYWLGIGLLFMTGCATAYKPTTRAGAICKQECSKMRMVCGGRISGCISAAHDCYDACEEMERFKEEESK